MRPRLVVDNSKSGHVVNLFEPVDEGKDKPHLYMDYDVAKMLIWLFFFTGFFAGASAIGMVWIFHG